MVGMAIAIVTTLVFAVTPAGIELGHHPRRHRRSAAAIGAFIARSIKMTAMPQLVAAFHSLVGLAAVLVAAAAFYAPESFGIGTARATSHSSAA